MRAQRSHLQGRELQRVDHGQRMVNEREGHEMDYWAMPLRYAFGLPVSSRVFSN